MRRRLVAGSAFAAIITIGVAALVYIHASAVPLESSREARLSAEQRAEAFAREQGEADLAALPTDRQEAPPPGGEDRTVEITPATSTQHGEDPTAGDNMLDLAGLDVDENHPFGSDRADAPMGESAETPAWHREILPPTGYRPASLRSQARMATASPLHRDSSGDRGFGHDGSTSYNGNTSDATNAAGMPASGSAARTDYPEADTTSTSAPVPLAGAPGSTHPQAIAPPQTASATAEPPPASGPDETAAPRDTPHAPAQRSLAAAQKARCGHEGFLGRLVCDERVRLAFCSERWDQHPDCMLEQKTVNY